MTKITLQKLKRLRAMPVAELFYRLSVALKDKTEKQRILAGGGESFELFVATLAGEGENLEDKFKNVFAAFQNRTFFHWQKRDQQKLISFYKNHFPTHYDATLAVTNNYLQHKFEILNCSLQFESDIDWHYDPLLKKSIPLEYWRDINYYSADVVKEVKYVWELNRCQHFVTLGKAFFLTGDENFARALFQQWTSWIDKNPYKMGVNWTSSLECAFRLISWTWALAFVRLSGHLNAGLYAKILQSVKSHAQFIAGHLSKYSSANNHLLGEALGLIYAGTFFPEIQQTDVWTSTGFTLFFDEFIRQVHEDGVSAEQTTYYQKYVFDFGILAMPAAEKINVTVPREVLNRLEKMAEFYAAILDKNGTVPHIGDDDGGCALVLDESSAHSIFDVLSTAAILFKRPDLKSKVTSLSESSFWLLENAADRFEELPAGHKDTRIDLFKSGGYIIINQQQPLEQKMLFDCGPLGLEPMAAHGHADALSVTLSVDGQPVLIDSGTWLYLGAGTERRYFRSTPAHNTLTVDGENQSEILGPFQWGRKAHTRLERVDENADGVIVSASHNGYRKKRIQHRRTIEAGGGQWIIKDFISGVGNHQIDVYFHCLVSNIKQDERVVVVDYSTFTVEFQFEKHETKEDKLSIDKAWHSFRFGQRDQHSVFHRKVIGSLPLELTTIINVYA